MGNPIVEAASTQIGPLLAWQWGLLGGGTMIVTRAVLPPSGTGSFFRRAEVGQGASAAAIGTGLQDRRPVAPFAGLTPAPTGGSAFVPGEFSNGKFVSVSTGEFDISGEGLDTETLIDLIGSIRGTNPTVEVPSPSPAEPGQPTPTTAQFTHTVRSGDTLAAIASRYLGDASRWPEILAQNPASVSRPGDERTLRIGYTLRFTA